jgi:integrase
MSNQLSFTLENLKHQRKVETLKRKWTSVPEWVFINRDGKPLDGPNWRNRIFNKVLEKAKLRKIRIHDLRHTYASLLIQGRESLAYIKDQLGHHSIKVTVDIYGHLAPEGNK